MTKEVGREVKALWNFLCFPFSQMFLLGLFQPSQILLCRSDQARGTH